MAPTKASDRKEDAIRTALSAGELTLEVTDTLGEKLQDLVNTNRELGTRLHEVLVEYGRMRERMRHS